MAYIPGFNWDVFISYPMEAKSWAEQFYKELKSDPRLSAATGLEIYFAQYSWELGQDSDRMLRAAESSALFIAVLTMDSLSEDKKRFLQLEMEAFRKSSSLTGRFCPIPLDPIDGRQLSRVMPLQNSQAFWNANHEFYFHREGVPLWLEPGKEPEPGRYRMAVGKVAYQLRKRLDEIKSGRTGSAASKGVFSSRTVLLAPNEPGSYAETDWLAVRNLLVNDGATVLPGTSAEADAVGSEAEFAAAVAKAELLVQVFSALDGLDRAKAQLKTVVEANKSISILQWRKKLPDVKKDEAILKSLSEDDREFCEGQNVQTGLLEDFKLAIREMLEKIAGEVKRPPSEKPYLYIAADTTDLRWARKLQEAALTRTDVSIMDEVEERRREDFEQALMLASGMIFVHGNAARQFVNRWLNEFVKKTRLLRIHPKLAVLYQAPPEKAEEDQPLLPTGDLRKVGSQREFTLEAIDQICAELCGERS